ncbi:hypothetical protein T265_03507 [Opisthorchis viverrini]|uniref:Uncharacterized protein n=1 Tax=Opisthorchis viverrini TaxID=6198 RepID=A0A075AHK2_OPIVI|nr:hypothetical protein T265_03507 [Opisthorchis viverrini]KER30029.1 hypothetical protein T265_03507 [Opisthorchis viverrini]
MSGPIQSSKGTLPKNSSATGKFCAPCSGSLKQNVLHVTAIVDGLTDWIDQIQLSPSQGDSLPQLNAQEYKSHQHFAKQTLVT